MHYDKRKQQVYNVLKIPYVTNVLNSSLVEAVMIQTVAVAVAVEVVVVVVIVIIIFITISLNINGSTGASVCSVMTRPITMTRSTLWRHI